jgi:hypothetical protein
MGEVLIAFATSVGLVLFTLTLATHATLWGDFKYYKPIYESFKRDDYKYSKPLDLIYFNYNREEIIFFPDGAIRLKKDVYIHLSFIHWFSPYSLYYRRKFNKLKDSLIYHHQLNEMRERELDRWRDNPFADSPFADYGPIGPVGFQGRQGPNGNETPVVKDIKPFKLLRG